MIVGFLVARPVDFREQPVDLPDPFTDRLGLEVTCRGVAGDRFRLAEPATRVAFYGQLGGRGQVLVNGVNLVLERRRVLGHAIDYGFDGPEVFSRQT